MAKVMDGSLPQDANFFSLHRGHAAAHRRVAGQGICGGHGAGHPAPAAEDESRTRLLSGESHAVCAFMKTITLDRILRSLETLDPQVCVPEEIARRARRAIDRMLEIV